MKRIKGFWTVAEAADELGITRQGLRKLINSYEIEWLRFGRQFILTADHLKEIRRCRRAAAKIRAKFGTHGEAQAQARALIINGRVNGDGARG